MPFPIAAALIGAGLLIKHAADVQAGNKQDRFSAQQAAHEKQQARKAAIERAMSGKYSSGPFGISRPDGPKAPSLTSQRVVGGIGEIMAALGGRMTPAPSSAPYSNIPGVGVT